MNNDELALALNDLGTHLDLGPAASPAGRAAMVDAVLARIERADRNSDERNRGPRPLLLAAAVLVVTLLAGLLAVPPTREAIADWLGVGGVRITRTSTTLPPSGQRPTSLPPTALDEAQEQVSFELRLADRRRVGPPRRVSVDPRVPDGLVEIRYRDFTLVELASADGEPPIVEKVVGPDTDVRLVTVDGHRGFWISGDPHQIGFVAVDGTVNADSVRRAGNVLVWEEGGVTYRIEGLESLDVALAIAKTLH